MEILVSDCGTLGLLIRPSPYCQRVLTGGNCCQCVCHLEDLLVMRRLWSFHARMLASLHCWLQFLDRVCHFVAPCARPVCFRLGAFSRPSILPQRPHGSPRFMMHMFTGSIHFFVMVWECHSQNLHDLLLLQVWSATQEATQSETGALSRLHSALIAVVTHVVTRLGSRALRDPQVGDPS